MELEELKASWNTLNERLSANESVTRHILKEMIRTRVRTSVSCLRRREVCETIICVFGAAIVCYIYFFSAVNMHLHSFVALLAAVTYGIVAQVCQLINLTHLDNDKSTVTEMLHHYIKYKRVYYGNFIIGAPMAIAALAIFYYSEMSHFKIEQITSSMTGFFIIFAICFVCSIVSDRYFKRMIKKMRKDIDELRDFDN